MAFQKMILSVSQINTYIKSLMDGDDLLKNVYIQGEISNFKNHTASGHYYFSLKDSSSVISAAMFRRENAKLAFMPENGMKVLVRGRISLYERSGTYSIYVDEMQPDGVGALYMAYEQIKTKLEKEGLFSPSLKKEIPRYPSVIGVITSSTGAAVRDIINVLSRRYPMVKILIVPVLVQGQGAAEQISSAIQKCNAKNLADVLIVGRGGGSIEDLWAFNDENLARTIVSSEIPVISAVGHETDFTIADFAADLRAPTPSAAAELAVPDQMSVLDQLSVMNVRMSCSLKHRVESDKKQLEILKQKPCLRSPMFSVNEKQMQVDLMHQRILQAYKNNIEALQKRFTVCLAKLDSLNPVAVLNRGYSIVYSGEKVVSLVKEVKSGDMLDIRVRDGWINCIVSGGRKENEKESDI